MKEVELKMLLEEREQILEMDPDVVYKSEILLVLQNAKRYFAVPMDVDIDSLISKYKEENQIAVRYNHLNNEIIKKDVKKHVKKIV